jgi:hypothetical protein
MLTYNEKSLQNLLCEGNAKNVNFQPFQTENFSLKKHHFWNFSSPASKKFFPSKFKHAISLPTKLPTK